MPRFRKELLKARTYWTVNAEGDPVPVSFTQTDIAHFAERGNEMVAAGYHIPIPLEHQPSAVPATREQKLADFVLHNTGEMGGFEVEGDTLFGLHDVERADVAAKIGKEIKYVSPKIYPRLTTGDGKQWDNVIGHVALTPQPVYFDQTPFGKQPAPSEAMALAMSLVDLEEPFCLSLPGAFTAEGKESTAGENSDPMAIYSAYVGPHQFGDAPMKVDSIYEHPDKDASPAEREHFHQKLSQHHDDQAEKAMAADEADLMEAHRMAKEYHAGKAGEYQGTTDVAVAPVDRQTEMSLSDHLADRANATQHGADAHAKSAEAYHASGRAYISGKPEHHEEASKLHNEAHYAHQGAAALASDIGTKQAHRQHAEAHRVAVAQHERQREHPTTSPTAISRSFETEMSAMAGEKNDLPTEGKGNLDDTNDKTKKPVESPDQDQPPKKPESEAGYAEAHFREAKRMLADKGIKLPDHASKENGWEHLCTALMNTESAGGKGTDDEPGNEAQDKNQAGATAQAKEEPQIVSMSLQQQQRMRQELQDKTVRLATVELQSNLDAIESLMSTGRIKPSDAQKWKQELGAKKMSLADGNDREANKILAKIEYAKTLPVGASWSPEERTIKLSATEPERPEYASFGDAAVATVGGSKISKSDQEAMSILLSMTNKGGGGKTEEEQEALRVLTKMANKSA